MHIEPATIPTRSVTGAREQNSTRLVFLAAGMGLASWAPLVPFAQDRLDVNEATLGMLLVCLGLGSLVSMPLAGSLASKLGCRKVILGAASVLILVFPILAMAGDVWTLAISLSVFGASVGAIDVTMNIQAALLERGSGKSLMSGFHGMFTLGSIFGAGGVTIALMTGLSPLAAAITLSLVLVVLMMMSAGSLLPYGEDGSEKPPAFAFPRGPVIVLGGFCFVVFLAEGVVLDWGALFLIDVHGIDPRYGGLAYACFAVAMTIGRFAGDRIVGLFGGSKVVLTGGAFAAVGFLISAIAPTAALALLGFAAVGLGASNIVPVLFSAAGKYEGMPSSMSMAVVGTMGYAGILVGPGLVGFVAHAGGLPLAVSLVAIAMGLVAVAGSYAVRSGN